MELGGRQHTAKERTECLQSSGSDPDALCKAGLSIPRLRSLWLALLSRAPHSRWTVACPVL